MVKKEPKLEYAFDQKAETEFRNELIDCFRRQLDVPESQMYKRLASLCDVSEGTASTRKKKPNTFTVPELRKIVKRLKPDIGTVLNFLGYRDQEIKKFAKGLMQ